MTKTQVVLEMLLYSPLNHLTRLLAREYFIGFNILQGFKNTEPGSAYYVNNTDCYRRFGEHCSSIFIILYSADGCDVFA
jgi:hypothetical protein